MSVICYLVISEIEAAEEAGEPQKAELLRKARRGELIRKLRQIQRRHSKTSGKDGSQRGSSSSGGKLTRAEVGESDVAKIISSWTG